MMNDVLLTAEQAQQIEEALLNALNGTVDLKTYYAHEAIRAARAQGRAETPFQLGQRLALAAIRAARAQERAETPFQLGQRLAREGQGISAIVYEIERDSDFDECLRGMRSVWNGDSSVAEQAEPVAMTTTRFSDNFIAWSKAIPMPGTKLYAAPVRTKDLTDEDFEQSEVKNLRQQVAVLKAVVDAWNNVEQEPVAWMVTSEGLDGTPKTYPLTGRFKDVCDMCDFGDPIPLYTRPARTKDLTDGEIADVFRAIHMKESWSLDFARAVIAKDRENNK